MYRFKKIYAQQLLLSLTCFVLILIIAMLIFPGGNMYDLDTNRYSFFQNFISHLGRENTPSGKPNPVNFYMFKFGIYLVSFSFVVFFSNYFILFKENLLSYKLSVLAAVFVFLAAIAFVFIGFFSADPESIKTHLLFVRISFHLFLAASVLQTIAIWINQNMTTRMFRSYLFFTLALIAYNLFVEFGPRPGMSLIALLLQVTAQKIIAITFIVNFYVQSIEILNFLSIKHQ